MNPGSGPNDCVGYEPLIFQGSFSRCVDPALLFAPGISTRLSRSQQSILTGRSEPRCARLLTLPENLFASLRARRRYIDCNRKVSNSDQLLFIQIGDHNWETSTTSLSFRSSELSQPSEVFFS